MSSKGSFKSTDANDWMASEFPGENASLRQLEALVWALATRPVPTGRLTRFTPAFAAPIKAAFTFMESWASDAFHGGSSREEILRRARVKAALTMLATMGHLRGLFIKVGQALANYPDLIPAEVADALWSLNFQAPPMHFSLVREMVKNELGGDPEDIFESFDTRPFAAASLGQVHRARLKTGEEVAVKIQYPNIGATIRQDLANLAMLFAPLRLGANWRNISDRIQDLRETLSLETDYENEARQLKAARELFDGDDSFVVPRVFTDLSTRRTLVMDYLPGAHLDRFLASHPSAQERDQYGTLILKSALRLYYQARLIYSDINPGNYIFMADGRLGLIDFGCIRPFSDDEWEFSQEMHHAGRIGGEALQAALRRSVTGSATGEVTEEYLAVNEEAARWIWEPIRAEGAFDFSGDEYFKRGLDIFKRLHATGDIRSLPINSWFSRCFLSVRAILSRLGARIDYRRVMESEGAPPLSG